MIVIADDLTGANDTGVQFASQGLTTEVLLEGISISSTSDADILVIDTNSRAVSSQDAYELVQLAAKQAQRCGCLQYYKKLDSTLRGNVGVEVKAILDLDYHDFALVMPAFPKNGRTTVGGHHLLHGLPLSATEIARDPKCPVYETVLPKMLQQQTECAVGHIGINDLQAGEDRITEAVKDYLASGCRIITCDAWLDEHFSMAVKAARRVSERVLWCGSAGLAECLPQFLGWTEQLIHKPILVISGSVSAVTRGQVERLVSQGYQLVEIEVAECLPWDQNNYLPCVDKVLDYLSQGENVVLASGYDAKTVDRAKETGAKYGLSNMQVSNITANIIGTAGASILRQKELSGVILTGGDTAVAVCRELGVKGIRVLEEVSPGIPVGSMTTAEGKIIQVVTKAGAFGSNDALIKAAHRLQQRR